MILVGRDKMRILVSWDDAAQIELLKMYLGLDDNAVFATTDREQFIAFVNSPQTFDVILMAGVLSGLRCRL